MTTVARSFGHLAALGVVIRVPKLQLPKVNLVPRTNDVVVLNRARASDLQQELRHQPVLSVGEEVGRSGTAAVACFPLCASRTTQRHSSIRPGAIPLHRCQDAGRHSRTACRAGREHT